LNSRWKEEKGDKSDKKNRKKGVSRSKSAFKKKHYSLRKKEKEGVR